MENSSLSRRDFIKLAALLPIAMSLPATREYEQNSKLPNILLLTFDAWSASNTSLYGYPRNTTPNIDRWADRGIVYHNHYAAGHYTYTSTTSLLTGVLPWTHNGYWNIDEFSPEFKGKNLFSSLDHYFRFAYTHNELADTILELMSRNIDLHQAQNSLTIENFNWFDDLFQYDHDTAAVSWNQAFELQANDYSNSIFLSRLYKLYKPWALRRFNDQFPRGLPYISAKIPFILENSIDWTVAQVRTKPDPFFGYVHFYPPHKPYHTRKDYVGAFGNDGVTPPKKPRHPFALEEVSWEDQLDSRIRYDEYLLYVDNEFDRLMNELKRAGNLENTIVILTSDHGEMFERGIPMHLIPSFHQPLVHIPMILFTPGQKQRIDIYEPTSNIDLYPTIMEWTNNLKPSWLEGEILPPFNPKPTHDRSIFSVDFRRSPKDAPYSVGAIMLRKGDFKLTFLFGSEWEYESLGGKPYIELFNVTEDPEELNNLYQPDDPLSKILLNEIKAKLEEIKKINNRKVER